MFTQSNKVTSPTMLVCDRRSHCVYAKNKTQHDFHDANRRLKPSRFSDHSNRAKLPGNGQVVDPAMRHTSRSPNSSRP